MNITEEDVVELVKMLRKLEWCCETEPTGGGTIFGQCPSCGGIDFRGHREGCELISLLLKYKAIVK